MVKIKETTVITSRSVVIETEFKGTSATLSGEISLDNKSNEYHFKIGNEPLYQCELEEMLGLIKKCNSELDTTKPIKSPKKKPSGANKGKYKHLSHADKFIAKEEGKKMLDSGYRKTKVFELLSEKFNISWSSARRYVMYDI